MSKMNIKEVRYNLPIPLAKDRGAFWVVTETFSISMLINGMWENFTFHKGCKTDLGSVPARLQGVVNNGSGDDLLMCIFLPHDNGYATHERNRKWYDEMLKSGIDSDAIEVVDAWDSALAYAAVRIGGGKAWKDRRNREGYEHKTMEPKPIYGLTVQMKDGKRVDAE